MNKDTLQHLQTRFNSKQKNFLISLQDTKQILQYSIKCISEQDFNCIFQDLTQQKSQFTFKQFLQLYFILQHQVKKVFNRIQPPTGVFLFQSLIMIKSSTSILLDVGKVQLKGSNILGEKDKVVEKYKQKQFISNISTSPIYCSNNILHKNYLILNRSPYINYQSIDVSRNFSSILSLDYQKKLINMGATGLINQKQQQKQKYQKYSYNQYVQIKQVDFILFDKQIKQKQLLKYVWMFQFQKAYKIALDIYDQEGKIKENQKYQEKFIRKRENFDEEDENSYNNSYNQIASLLPGLENFKQLSHTLDKYPILKQFFQQRSQLQIQFKQQLIKKQQPFISISQLSLLQSTFFQCLTLFQFTLQYFQQLVPQLCHPYFKSLAQFLSSNPTPHFKPTCQIQSLSNLQQLSIIQRFLYTKKFYTTQNFQVFKQLIKQKLQKIYDIDYILLYGNKKQSEKILQNYLDKYSDIQKVAEISVYLKTFSEQSKITTIRQQKSVYSKFIEVYQWLLDKYDGGISRLVFDKKCLSIQIQRKRKNLTKTYTFDCSNCKSPQLYSTLSKKITIDSKQPKLKGYHYFAKDARKQIMYCIQCMQLLPRCSICLYPISVYNAYAEEMKKNMTEKKVKNKGEFINDALIWCPECKHGGHFEHVDKWFNQKENRKCPVVNCKCKCKM